MERKQKETKWSRKMEKMVLVERRGWMMPVAVVPGSSL